MHKKYLPSVFTYQGLAMLATILKSNVATQVSIAIMDAFVNMRHYILENKDMLNNINNKLIEHDEKIDYIFAAFDKKEQLFLPNESYDAYSEIVNIITKVKEEIIIIDSYADKTILDFIRNVNAKIILIISDKAKLNDLELEKCFYHIGTSLNRVGGKFFSINKLEDKIVKDNLLKYVLEIIS